MAYRTLHIEYGGGSLATVWLDRPGHRNAVNALMLTELSAAFAGFADAPDLRAVVLAARGPAFCAGIEREHAENMNITDAALSAMPNAVDTALGDALQAIEGCAVPVVVRVHGDCLGAGMALAACCDIVVAAGQARFCCTEPGVPVQMITPWLAKAMSSRAARRYLLTGERFSAFEAQQLGIVHEVAAIEALDERTNAIAGALLREDAQNLAERRGLLRQLDKEV